MGTKCPPGTQDGAVKQLCENSDVRTSFESIFPVTDSSSHFSYINRYCAICNGADLHPLAATWKVEISCNDFIPSATSNLLSTLRKENCDISFQAPLAASTCELPPYTISECNKTGKWSVYDHEIDLACNSFIDPFNYTYMNYFCYVSNTDKVISIRQIQNLCPEPFPEMTITTPSGPQFTMVLELNSIRKMEAEIVLSCDSTTHFVDFKKVCILFFFSTIYTKREFTWRHAGGRMVQWCWVNFQCRGVLLIWIIVGQGPTALAVGVSRGRLEFFSLVYHFSFLSPSLWKTARFRLKYCLKEPLNPEPPTNQPTNVATHVMQYTSMCEHP